MKFVVAGDGEGLADLIKLSERLGIGRNVKFLGRVRNIPELLSRIDIGVISSDSEGFSNAILEFMASGVPVIATDVGGNSEIIKNGINGYLVAKGNYRALGERIVELATDNKIYESIVKRAIILFLVISHYKDMLKIMNSIITKYAIRGTHDVSSAQV